MKKIFTLLTTMIFTGSFFAQGSESFTNLNASTGTYGDGSFTGDNSVVWTYGQARKATGNDAIKTTSIGLKDTGTRFVKANSGINGVGTLTYSVRSYFTGGTAADRTVEVWVNGTKLETYTLAAMATTYTRTVTANVDGDVLIEFKSTGTRQIVLDDISWTASTLSVGDTSKTKNIFLKNTMVDNTLSFQTKGNATVRVYNTNGQLVKSATISAQNANVNVANLPKGNYVVTAELNGETVSQKILKK